MSGYRAAYQRLTPNARGTLWMLASAVTFTVMTMLVKLLGDDYSAALQTFYRQAFSLLVMLPLILRDPVGVFRTTRPWTVLLRSLAGTLGVILGFYSYQHMPLADANALSFTRTLWLVPMAAFILKEHVGVRRLSATLVGFAGALLMLQPAAQSNLGLPAIAALASALLLAITVAGVKFLTRDHSTTTLMAWAAVLGFVLSLLPALHDWRWPAPVDLALLAAMGVIGLISQGCYIKGMSEGDAAVMAPVDYTRLVFALVLGYLWFSEVPDWLTMAGAGVVIASTLYITIRESRLGVPKTPRTRSD